MYSIRPHSSENIEFDLPKTMYSVQPIIQSSKTSQNNPIVLKDIEQRQEKLLEKLDYLFQQYNLLTTKPLLEPLVVHLSATKPSKEILKFIDNFREKISLRTYRHSSLGAAGKQFQNPLQTMSTSTTNRPLTVIWAEGDQLPYMFHSQMKITDEQEIVNLLSQQLTNVN